MNKVAIIGGSGVENLGFIESARKLKIDTPYGDPSPDIKTGKFNNMEIVHLARHGKDHTIPSVRVNYKANIYALQELGCSHILSTATCGSLQEEICPGELVIMNQFIDFTKHRSLMIFEDKPKGELKSIPMAEPFSEELRDNLIEAAVVLGITIHTKCTVISIEGHRYSTRAESNLYRAWGADIINMSTAPEAMLANEFGIPYAAVALCTDYDSWRTDLKTPTAEEIIDIVNENAGNINELIKNALLKF
jgi:5'-methylthioadenosine phosphorylase